MTAFALIVIGGLLLGGALSVRRLPVPNLFAVLLAVAGVLATVGGALRL